jgi:hypothetical protein
MVTIGIIYRTCKENNVLVSGHLIVTDAMTNLDMLQSNVALEVDAVVNTQQVTLAEVDMGAEETVDECISRTDQETNSGQETECSATNTATPEMQVEEVYNGYSILIIILMSLQ